MANCVQKIVDSRTGKKRRCKNKASMGTMCKMHAGKRRSPKRRSPKRRSPKRRSPKRGSPKRRMQRGGNGDSLKFKIGDRVIHKTDKKKGTIKKYAYMVKYDDGSSQICQEETLLNRLIAKKKNETMTQTDDFKVYDNYFALSSMSFGKPGWVFDIVFDIGDNLRATVTFYDNYSRARKIKPGVSYGVNGSIDKQSKAMKKLAGNEDILIETALREFDKIYARDATEQEVKTSITPQILKEQDRQRLLHGEQLHYKNLTFLLNKNIPDLKDKFQVHGMDCNLYYRGSIDQDNTIITIKDCLKRAEHTTKYNLTSDSWRSLVDLAMLVIEYLKQHKKSQQTIENLDPNQSYL